MTKADPFTRTPGIAGNAYIDNKVADEIIANLLNKDVSKYVYKITGLRGTGKSVEFGRIMNTMKDKPKWKVYQLPAAGDVVKTLLSKLSEEDFIDEKKTTTTLSGEASVEGSVKVIKGEGSVSVSKTSTVNENYYSEEAEVLKLIKEVNRHKYSVLIGVDDIARTPSAVLLLSIIGNMIMDDDYKVYLVVTGLSSNIEDFSKEPNLTFFKRADEYEIPTLDKYDVSYNYQRMLKVSEEKSVELYKLTKGYAYAYQVLGSLYFSKVTNGRKDLEDIIPEFERILFKDVYDIVWKTLTSAEKELVKCICRSDGTFSQIREKMSNPGSYSMLRESLIKKHIIDASERGKIIIKLPSFDKYVELWGDD